MLVSHKKERNQKNMMIPLLLWQFDCTFFPRTFSLVASDIASKSSKAERFRIQCTPKTRSFWSKNCVCDACSSLSCKSVTPLRLSLSRVKSSAHPGGHGRAFAERVGAHSASTLQPARHVPGHVCFALLVVGTRRVDAERAAGRFWRRWRRHLAAALSQAPEASL